MRAFIGTTDPIKLNALKLAFAQALPGTNVEIYGRVCSSDPLSDSRSISIDQIRTAAIYLMKKCYPYDVGHATVFSIGIERGYVQGEELNGFFGKSTYCTANQYDVGVGAITVFKGGASFKYISYTSPLKIPNNVDAADILAPCESEFPRGGKHNSFLSELIIGGLGLYRRYSIDQFGVEHAFRLAFLDALSKLNNIHLFNPSMRFDVVILFGTFDLFHDLHKRLIDHAYAIGRRIVINIYGKETKLSKNTKVRIHDDVQKRISAITEYVLIKHTPLPSNIVVNRMRFSHPIELARAIDFYRSKGKLAVMGGDDQFHDYGNIVKICAEAGVPIIALNRGETKTSLCSSDLRERIGYQRIANIHDIDMNTVSPFFWKQRIRSLPDAKKYLQQLRYLGLVEPEIWHYIPSRDRRITAPIKFHRKTILTLPGRTPCNPTRLRKIALTIERDFNMLDADICIGCYEQNDHDTDYHLRRLEECTDYFSDDAMIFTKLIIMPHVCQGLGIRKIEHQWIVQPGQIEPLESIMRALANITIWARSIGSVIAIEMENAFRFCMQQLGFENDAIIEIAKHICVLSISNLAPLDRPRLFTTASITGLNDKKARAHIKSLPDGLPPNSNISCSLASETHLSIIAIIPQSIVEYGTAAVITDNNCHYTPLYTAIRQDDDNTVPNIIRQLFGVVVSRSFKN